MNEVAGTQPSDAVGQGHRRNDIVHIDRLDPILQHIGKASDNISALFVETQGHVPVQ